MGEEKKLALEKLGAQNQDSHNTTSNMMQISSLFNQIIFLLGQKFIITTLIDGKSKVKEMLKDKSNNLNYFSNKYLFNENEFSKSVTAKQKSQSLFIGLNVRKTNLGGKLNLGNFSSPSKQHFKAQINSPFQ